MVYFYRTCLREKDFGAAVPCTAGLSFYYIDAPRLLHIQPPPQIGLAATQLGFSGSIIITTRTRSSSTNHFTYPPTYLIAAMDLAPPPVGELYVNHEELIAAANTWAEAHAYVLNIV